MNTIGFPISVKENERRRALVPGDLERLTSTDNLYLEVGYGESLGYTDEDYLKRGANLVPRGKILTCDIICDPKVGDASYLDSLQQGTVVFGWAHAVQNRHITDAFIENKLTVVAWEDMFEGPRHVFWRNNEIAGEMAVLHAFSLYGKLPSDCRVALLGRGNVARGAYKALIGLGADTHTFTRDSRLQLLEELSDFDVIVNGLLWDAATSERMILRSDLEKLSRPSMIIDVSCDRHGTIETSVPTTIEDPTFVLDGVLHYAVDHTPALAAISASAALSTQVVKYLEFFRDASWQAHPVLGPATILRDGVVIDERIIKAQNR